MSAFWTEYQRQVNGGLWIKTGIDPLTHSVLGLVGESGEVADLVKKAQYVNGALNYAKLVEEMGDALWYWTNVAHWIGYSPQYIAEQNIVKLEGRHGSGHYNAVRLFTATAPA